MTGLEGKNVFITGGGSGIGRATALLFAEEGVKRVIIGDLNVYNARKVAEEVTQSGVLGMAIALDVTKLDSIEKAFKTIDEECGQIDILVNCAGICKLTPFNEITLEDWETVLRINLTGTFLCCQKVIESMILRRVKGSIVNLSSIAGKVGGIFSGAHYSTSKAGINCLTIVAAKYSAKHGIRVNAVSPGTIDTSMTEKWGEETKEQLSSNIPLGRYGTAQEVAEAIVFLASPKASHITGEILDVNGGSFMD